MKTNDPTRAAAVPQTAAHPVWSSWWWFAGAGLLLLGTPFLFSSPRDAELEARRRHIENLSSAERERLERNFERFEKLPADRRAELREMQEAVQGDPGLKNTLNEYERWLTTLSPWQRAELRKAPSHAEKRDVVQSIVAEQRRHAEDQRQQEQEIQEQVRINLAKFQGPKPQGVRLTDEELSKMLSVLETHVPPEFHQRQHKQTGSPAYQMQLLAAVLKDRYLNQNEESREQPLPAPLIEEMIVQVSDPKAREQMQKLYDERHEPGFVSSLAGKLYMAWWHEAWENYSRAELEEIARNLGGEALRIFESEKEKNPGRAYFHLFISSKRSELANKDAKELNDILDKLDLRRDYRRPGEGPVGGRFGDRRGGPRREGRKGERSPRQDDGPSRNEPDSPDQSPPNPDRASSPAGEKKSSGD